MDGIHSRHAFTQPVCCSLLFDETDSKTMAAGFLYSTQSWVSVESAQFPDCLHLEQQHRLIVAGVTCSDLLCTADVPHSFA